MGGTRSFLLFLLVWNSACWVLGAPTLSCSDMLCVTGTVCLMINDQPRCVPSSEATCWAWGDPHYHTFDGHDYDFQGTCIYTIVKTCGNTSGLPSFHISAKLGNRGNKRVSYVEMVTVEVYGYTITMIRTEFPFVRVDGIRTSVPISLNNGVLQLSQSGTFIILAADFRLRVSYDCSHHLYVTITSAYHGRVCGLCGNYNGNSTDDFQTSAGTVAPNATAFGESWSLRDGSQSCWHDCHGACQPCPPSEAKKYETEFYCGLIITNGSFTPCHGKVNPTTFFESCVHDMCFSEGHIQSLCNSLKAYAETCQRNGVRIGEWRRHVHCPLACPPNSQYQLCGTACPATCVNDKADDIVCPDACVEGCQCKQGFVLSQGECIPKSSCGCLYEGRPYVINESFWADDACGKRCVCTAATREVKCATSACKPSERCQVVNGVRGCYPSNYATCYVSGSLHYLTFDKHKFDFKGACAYVLTEVCHNPPELERFSLYVQSEYQGSHIVSFSWSVQVNVLSTALVASRQYPGRILVNGLLTYLPYSTVGGRIDVFRKGPHLVIRTDFGLTITFDWENSVTVTVPSTYADTLCGLCGNFNGNSADDAPVPGSILVPSKPVFGNGTEAEASDCNEVIDPKCPDLEAIVEQQRASGRDCGLILATDGPFQECHDHVDAEAFFHNCVYNYCHFRRHYAFICAGIASYATACQAAEVTVRAWRSSHFCPPSCPPNSHYELCSKDCSQTCSNLYVPTPCLPTCKEGCVCNEDFVMSSAMCVPVAQCGCFYKGRYYPVGETSYTDCQEHCVCQTGGNMACVLLPCGPKEECKVVEGIQKCHPIQNATCSTTGHAHYLSFDGLPFEFQGTCTYILAKTHNVERNLIPFTVIVEKEAGANEKDSVVKLVSVEVYEMALTLLQKKRELIKVNGVFHRLPVNLLSGQLRVYQERVKIVIETNFGLAVSYDLACNIRVTIPSVYQGMMGGLCGNYNEQTNDDFQLPDGSVVSDVVKFGGAWKIPIPGVSCTDGCSGNNCSVYKEKSEIFRQRNYCGVLTACDGPFSTCHDVVNPSVYLNNCVFDLCMRDGDKEALCQNIQSYVIACQEAKVSIQPWRSSSFCPLHCPANSHYTICSDVHNTTCVGIKGHIQYPEACTEGCQCDDGFFFDGLQCISMNECGCFRGGHYFPPNESVLLNNCTERCTCSASEGFICVTHACLAAEACEVKDGTMQCYSEGIAVTPFLVADESGSGGGDHQAGDIFDGTAASGITVTPSLIVDETGAGGGDHQAGDISDGTTASGITVTPSLIVDEAGAGGGDHQAGDISDGTTASGITVTPSLIVDEAGAGGGDHQAGDIFDGTAASGITVTPSLIVDEAGAGGGVHQAGDIVNGASGSGIAVTPFLVIDEAGAGGLCEAMVCRPKEICHIEEGWPICVPQYVGTCWVWGGLHYRTFDGYDYDLPGNCTYVLVQSNGSMYGLVPFLVEEKNENRGSSKAMQQIIIHVYEHKITISKGEHGRVLVNDVRCNLPITLAGGRVSVSWRSNSTVVQTECGLRVTLHWDWHVQITLLSSYYNTTGGLCGNFNQLSEDEWVAANGTQLSTLSEWAGAWVVEDGDPQCFHQCQGECQTCEGPDLEEYSAVGQCGVISAPEGPFQNCHSVLDPEIFLRNCAYDVCMNRGDSAILCQAVSSYAHACHHKGRPARNWRIPIECSLPCPVNSHYVACGNACPASCSDSTAPSSCQQPCVEICQCNKGFVLSVDKCVPLESCGCTYNTLYYEPGEEFWAGENCDSLCKCDASQGTVVCNPDGCKAGEECAVFNGVRGCHTMSPSTCTASGNHSYTTFDGQRYEFNGTCLYQLAGVCSGISTLVPFNVFIQNSPLPNDHVVICLVYGMNITLQAGFWDKIKVNDTVVDLPFSLEEKIHVTSHGSHLAIVVDTDLSISVLKENLTVVVSVPGNYMGHLCGLCGNANGNSSDDKIGELGERWRVGCSPGCSSDCPPCTSAELESYHEDKHCGLLLQIFGPFAACQDAVPSKSFFNDCVSKTCEVRGQQPIWCNVIASYVTVCQAKDFPLKKWRTDAFCPFACPANSHYELCGSKCPPSCDNLSGTCDNLSDPHTTQLCAEGCFCDAGFVLNEDHCVSIRECACEYQGKYYKKGEEFFSNATCRERCRCQENGTIHCYDDVCNGDSSCKVVGGLAICFPREHSICYSLDNQHYITFDGVDYSLPASCSYILAQSDGQVNFSVVEIAGSHGTGELRIQVSGYQVALLRGRRWEALVNGEFFHLPFALADIWVHQEGRVAVLRTLFGLQVYYDLENWVAVFVLGLYRGLLRGLCGNYNGNKSDEFLMPNGERAHDAVEFGTSWKDKSGNCSDGCDNCHACDKDTEQIYQANNYCGMIQANLGPFSACHSVVDPTQFFSYCLVHMCATSGTQESLCQSLQAYATACHAAGAMIEPWRTDTFCPLNCLPGTHYDSCARTCNSTCATAFPCVDFCFESCKCDLGTLANGAACVNAEECGCWHNGRLIKQGQSILSSDCKTSYACQRSGSVISEPHSCADYEMCGLRGGLRGCFSTEGHCALTPGARFSSFDGLSGKVPALGTYELTSLCDMDSDDWFRVLVRISSCPPSGIAAATVLYVFFKGAFIAVLGQKEAWVNGQPVQIPSKVSESVTLDLASKAIVLRLSQVEVILNADGEALVTVTPALAGKLCGACGNFNGNQADDKLDSGEVDQDSVTRLLASWRARDFIHCVG